MNLGNENKLGNKSKPKVHFLQLLYICYTYIKNQISPKVVMKFWTHD